MRLRWVGVVLLALVMAGCGRQKKQESADRPLTFEELKDTTGLSAGEPLLTHVNPYRTGNQAVRVHGRLELPDGTRVQLSIVRADTKEMVHRMQVYVRDGRFDTPPVRPGGKPLPPGRYRFEYFALFNAAWQKPEVLRQTGGGRTLRGPGITRDQAGGAAFFLVEERTL
jgi:hypothetical protein